MNGAETQEVKHLLLASHPEYRELADLHHSLDTRLHQLVEKHYLTDTEQIEETNLKKRKLALKDQMERIVTDWASTNHNGS
jgi:uncharacterized protein YdcH (DUF465 family)